MIRSTRRAEQPRAAGSRATALRWTALLAAALVMAACSGSPTPGPAAPDPAAAAPAATDAAGRDRAAVTVSAAFGGADSGTAAAPACAVDLERAARSAASTAADGSAPPTTTPPPSRISGLEHAPGNEIAAFGMGCFWGAEALFGARLGVVRTGVGFAGGRHPEPTYLNIADHIETVLVEYDPEVVSYGDLLEIFWDGHNPGSNPWLNQYRSMLFPVTDGQEAIARRAVVTQREERLGAVLTGVRRIDRFVPDRTYHDKYYLRNHEELWAGVVAAFGTQDAALGSTVAARLNALAAGKSSPDAVAAAVSEATKAGRISPRAAADLRDMIPGGRRSP